MGGFFTTLDATTKWLTGIILLVTTVAFIYVLIQSRKDGLLAKRHWIENIPSIISTLGVLGTFWGITKGLIAFDANDLNNSIPELLTGLKTAFFTSLAGMIGSLLLTWKVNKSFDDKEKGVSDINTAASQIVDSVKLMSENLKEQSEKQTNSQVAFYSAISTELKALSVIIPKISEIENYISLLYDIQPSPQEQQQRDQKQSAFEVTHINLVNEIKAALCEITNDTKHHIDISSAVSHDLDDVLKSSIAIASVCGNIKTTIANVEAITSEINRNSAECLALSEAQSNIQQEISTNVGMFGEILHGEVIEVEDSMEKTNKLLEKKFDEFSELLKKSNTESLVEVMHQVTVEFEKQMNSLISKLIQENFDELNTSVERLNTWQIENKEMIRSLTVQYKNMVDSFEETSDVLDRVSKSTDGLVRSDGKLAQIVDALSKVMIEDEKFVQITKNICLATNDIKTSSEQTRDLSNSLSVWIQKQKSFADSVQLLVQKLDQINKIKDYGEQFWAGTKRNMEEGVSIIAQGSKTLNDQINILDRQFYNRLNATLSELDTCIQAMIKSQD